MKTIFLFILLIFTVSFHYSKINADDTLSLGNKYHVDFVVIENGNYGHCIIDSVFYYDSEKNKYIKFENLICDYGGFSFPSKDTYLKFMNSDTIVFCHLYEDIKNNIRMADDIKIDKATISSSFKLEIEGKFLKVKKMKGVYQLSHRFTGCRFGGVLTDYRFIDMKKKHLNANK